MTEITMEDAVAAGDGTIHGAIDHWQGKHAEAEEQIKELQDLTIQLSERLAECQRDLLEAQGLLEEAMLDQPISDWTERAIKVGAKDMWKDIGVDIREFM